MICLQSKHAALVFCKYTLPLVTTFLSTMGAYSAFEFVIGFIFMLIGYTYGGNLYLPSNGRLPFMVYFPTPTRAMCVGTLVSNMFVLTAASCFMRTTSPEPDFSPINIVYGDNYRHIKRGQRVAVVKIYFPKIPEDPAAKAIFVEKAPAVMELITRTIAGAEFVPKYLRIDYTTELHSRDQVITAGWNFYTGYKMVDNKYILQKYLHAAMMTIVKDVNCERNFNNLTKYLADFGNNEPVDKSPFLCVVDKPYRKSIPCIGMYGAPLIHDNAVVGIFTAPNGQYKNCSISALYTKLSVYKDFLSCLEGRFTPTFNLTVNILPDAQVDDSFDMTYYDDYNSEDNEFKITNN